MTIGVFVDALLNRDVFSALNIQTNSYVQRIDSQGSYETEKRVLFVSAQFRWEGPSTL